MQTPADFIEFRPSWAKVDLQLLGVLSSALSMKSVTVNELQFKLLQVPPSFPGVWGLEDSPEASFRDNELSPSLVFLDLLLFFFEDILKVEILST